MKFPRLIIALALALPVVSGPASAQTGGEAAAQPTATQQQPIPTDQENARKAKALLEQALQALGGQAYLEIRNMEQEGRTYSFYHGRPTSNGVVFWRFVEYPDKERLEVTRERDVAYLYNGDKGYELTYKGPKQLEKKDLDDYLRRRKFSLDTLLRDWANDPTVAYFYDGTALAGNLPAQQITLINAKNEAVDLFFVLDTHLPIKKSYKWRDPVDKERDFEEEIYDNYRVVQGVMIPWGFTRYFNGDMQSQRFVSAVRLNQGLNEAMFDPYSKYDPNKPAGKH